MCDLCGNEIDMVNDITQYYRGGLYHKKCYDDIRKFETDPILQALEIVDWIEIFISFNVPYNEKSSPKNRINELKELIKKIGDKKCQKE